MGSRDSRPSHCDSHGHNVEQTFQEKDANFKANESMGQPGGVLCQYRASSLSRAGRQAITVTDSDWVVIEPSAWYARVGGPCLLDHDVNPWTLVCCKVWTQYET